jgi:hypothetical protein
VKRRMLKGYGQKKLEELTKEDLIMLCKSCKIYDSSMKDMDRKDLVKDLIFFKIQTKKTKQRIGKGMRMAVWNKVYGPEVGQTDCPMKFCKNKISQMSFDSGHIIAESKGGKTELDNLVPICHDCNIAMGTENMEEFKRKYSSSSLKTNIGKSVPSTNLLVCSKEPIFSFGFGQSEEKDKKNPPESKECIYRFVKGDNKGQQCKKSVSKGSYCNKHQPKNEENGCQFVLTRGDNKGKKCGKVVVEKQCCKTHLGKSEEVIEIFDSDDEEDEYFKERLEDLSSRIKNIIKDTVGVKQRMEKLTVVCLKFIISDLYNFSPIETLKAGLVEECLSIVNTETLDYSAEVRIDNDFRSLWYDFIGFSHLAYGDALKITDKQITIDLTKLDPNFTQHIINLLQNQFKEHYGLIN